MSVLVQKQKKNCPRALRRVLLESRFDCLCHLVEASSNMKVVVRNKGEPCKGLYREARTCRKAESCSESCSVLSQKSKVLTILL